MDSFEGYKYYNDISDYMVSNKTFPEQEYNIQICSPDKLEINIDNLTDLGDLTDLDNNINHNIINERNNSIHDLCNDISDMNESFIMLADMINDQGENLDTASNHIEMSELETTEGVNNLREASEFVKNKLIMIRNISLIVGGGILGASGFLFGPVIGIGTVIAGSAAGGATVAGLNKLSKK